MAKSGRGYTKWLHVSPGGAGPEIMIRPWGPDTDIPVHSHPSHEMFYVLEGEIEKLIQEAAFKKFYMHRTSHWLGMDVHDAGPYKVSDEWRRLAPGMVLTVEPGLYIAEDIEGVDPRYRGIGIRIEDDVLVTDEGHEVLSAGVPKTIAEIENAINV